MPKGKPERGLDEQLLEGGGGGGGFTPMRSSTLNPKPTGSRSARDYKEKADRESEFTGEISWGSPSRSSSDRTPRTSDDYAGGGMTEDDKKAEKYRKEAKTGGTDAPVPAAAVQEAADKKMQEKAKIAPTTKTEMGKPFARGGMTASSRADGCCVKGKTRGKMV